MPAGKSFISYSRKDGQFILQLAKDLRDAGADIWLDQLDIEPGTHWDLSVEKALQDCPNTILVMSPDSVNSNNVMDEFSYAIGSDKRVIPIMLKKCDVPFRLKRVQYIDFTDEYDKALARLVDVLNDTDAAPTNTPRSEIESKRDQPANSGIKDSAELENLMWKKATESGKASAVQAYLEEYPEGEFSAKARELLKSKLKDLNDEVIPDQIVINLKGKKKLVLFVGGGLLFVAGMLVAADLGFNGPLSKLFSPEEKPKTAVVIVDKPVFSPENPPAPDTATLVQPEPARDTVQEQKLLQWPLSGAFSIEGLAGKVCIEECDRVSDVACDTRISSEQRWSFEHKGHGFYAISTFLKGIKYYLGCDVINLKPLLCNNYSDAHKYWRVTAAENSAIIAWQDEWLLDVNEIKKGNIWFSNAVHPTAGQLLTLEP